MLFLKSLLRRLSDGFLFTSLFLSFGAGLMAHQTFQLLQLPANEERNLQYFIFFATLCSYNFHWWLTPFSASELNRSKWSISNRWVHEVLILVGAIGSAWWAYPLLKYWPAILPSILLTFLYSAPKLPFWPFIHLKKFAYGKTIFLAMVWMYVTTALPIWVSGNGFDIPELLFCTSRFFGIYAICILFDWRDRETDKKEGIKSLITWFNEKGIDRLFSFSLVVFSTSTIALINYGVPAYILLVVLLPGALTALLYKRAKKDFSDYLYYFVLDGLMLLSSAITIFLPF
ncbi:MAG: UbiA family prenyltransferase [Chitinophagaceae bacterium]|nr:UbiA family prenyltransferase [Chitinophagaceae bacterium]